MDNLIGTVFQDTNKWGDFTVDMTELICFPTFLQKKMVSQYQKAAIMMRALFPNHL